MSALVVVFPGRFQPFHRGHHGVYLALCQRFGADAVYLASSDRTGDAGGRPAPFSFAEKQKLIVKLFDVEPSRIVQVKSPYGPREILSHYDPATTAFVAVTGARDDGRLKSRYWRPYAPDVPLEPYPGRGYILTAPPAADDLSASTIRGVLGDPGLSRDAKIAAFNTWYPRWDEALFDELVARLTGATPPEPERA